MTPLTTSQTMLLALIRAHGRATTAQLAAATERADRDVLASLHAARPKQSNANIASRARIELSPAHYLYQSRRTAAKCRTAVVGPQSGRSEHPAEKVPVSGCPENPQNAGDPGRT